MSREDHRLAVAILRDALTAACDVAETYALLSVPEPERPRMREEIAKWRAVIVRTDAEDAEWDPPFSEHARQAAWDAWREAHERMGKTITVTKRDDTELWIFREWWMARAEKLRPKPRPSAGDAMRPPAALCRDCRQRVAIYGELCAECVADYDL